MSTRTPDEIHNVTLILGITTALITLCYILYFLRILSRKLLRTPLWIDDWWMLFALFVCSGMSILNYVGVSYGSGVHRSHLEKSEYRSFQINLYVFMMFWALGVLVVKIGILLFYWRIFSVRDFRRRVVIVGALLMTTHIAIFIVFMFQCTPIPRFWADTTSGYCINQVDFYISGGSLNIAGDVLILSLPIRQVWKLKASRNQRLALVFLFCLGGFVCITSIFRLISLNEINPEDFSYTNVGGGLWSTVEVQVGFICANLPHTRPLAIRLLRPWRSSGTATSGTGATPHSNSNRRSAHFANRSNRNTAGFRTLGSQGKEIGLGGSRIVEREMDQTESNSEQASIGTYGSDHELTAVGIAVKTEMTQEVRQAEELGTSSTSMSQCHVWENENVSTNISASAAKR